jgi:hypothetical protein
MKTAGKRFEAKPGGFDCCFGIAGRLAAAERTRPEEGVERPLEPAERRVGGANVLPEAELAAGDQHSAELPKRGGGVGHATEEPHDDSGIERAVFRRQSGGIALHDVDRNPRRVCTLCRGGTGRGIRLDGQHVLDFRRVVLERAAVPAADLDHPPAQSGEHPPTKLARDGIGPAQLTPLEVPGETRLLRAVEGGRPGQQLKREHYGAGRASEFEEG